MVDTLDEAGTYHLITNEVTHAYFDTRICINVVRIDILFNRVHSEVVLVPGSVIAAGLVGGLAGRLFSGFLFIRLRLCSG